LNSVETINLGKQFIAYFPRHTYSGRIEIKRSKSLSKRAGIVVTVG